MFAACRLESLCGSHKTYREQRKKTYTKNTRLFLHNALLPCLLDNVAVNDVYVANMLQRYKTDNKQMALTCAEQLLPRLFVQI